MSAYLSRCETKHIDTFHCVFFTVIFGIIERVLSDTLIFIETVFFFNLLFNYREIWTDGTIAILNTVTASLETLDLAL